MFKIVHIFNAFWQSNVGCFLYVFLHLKLDYVWIFTFTIDTCLNWDESAQKLGFWWNLTVWTNAIMLQINHERFRKRTYGFPEAYKVMEELLGCVGIVWNGQSGKLNEKENEWLLKCSKWKGKVSRKEVPNNNIALFSNKAKIWANPLIWIRN